MARSPASHCTGRALRRRGAREPLARPRPAGVGAAAWSSQSSGRPRKRPRMVGDSGGFSAVRSSRSRQTRRPARRSPEMSRRKSAGSAATARRTRASNSAGVISGRAGRPWDRRAVACRQAARRPPPVARALVDEPQMIERVGVIGRLGQHLLEVCPRLVEAAELEQRHAALVAGRREARAAPPAPRRSGEAPPRPARDRSAPAPPAAPAARPPRRPGAGRGGSPRARTRAPCAEPLGRRRRAG